MKKVLLGLAGVFLLLAGVLGGCATERSPLDKTDPNALDKRLFEGEWFYKQTVVDLPYSVDYSFIGETNALKIIKWEITESWLIGYNIHEKIESTDTNGNNSMAKTPIIAYPIKDHFDIKYAENAATGEDLPVYVANHDKPWWQRKYFTIDPASSAVTNFELEYLNISMETDAPYTQSPVSGYNNLEFMSKEVKDAKGNVVTAAQGIDPKHYEPNKTPVDTLSFTTDMIVTPNNNYRYIYSWDDLIEFISWESARIRQRHFFWKVDRDELNSNGFKTMEFQDEMFRRFGFFTREYRAVDPMHGYKEDYSHYWANHFNLTGDHVIDYYLGPDFPHYLELASCSIAADYNYALAKATYEGQKAAEAFDAASANGGSKGFVSDFPSQIKLQDGLYELDGSSSKPTSLLLPDAFEPWPSDLKLDTKKYYYIDYMVALLKPKAEWAGKDVEKQFTDRRDAMIKAYTDYCFSTPGTNDQGTDKFVLHRNEFLAYDATRDGVDPDGKANSITPDEIRSYFGDDIDSWVARKVDYPVACRLTLEHRCDTKTVNGVEQKVPRWKAELGDPRYSMIYWVDIPTEYGILGVAQWSDNPESGQLFSGVAHIAGSVLQWAVSREIERYQMISALKATGYDPTSDRYTQLLNDLVINPAYSKTPQAGEENSNAVNSHFQAVNGHLGKAVTINKSVEAAPVGSTGWKISAVLNPTLREKGATGQSGKMFQDPKKTSPISTGSITADDYKRLQLLQQKHLPTDVKNTSEAVFAASKGTGWESYLAPNSVLSFLFPGATSYDEDQLYGISPAYWGSYTQWQNEKTREQLFTKNCYFQGDWLDAGFLEMIKDLDGKGYTVEDIRRVIETIEFKAVAQHEIGHSVGLRHNFMASADELNYAGTKSIVDSSQQPQNTPTGYWAFKSSYKTAVDAKVTEYEQKVGRSATEQERFYLSKQVATPRDWYMYSSVMDYMDEFYFHGFGLGRYDLGALLFVYGRAVEKYQHESGNIIKKDTFGNPVEEVQTLYEYRYCTADDLSINDCVCTQDDTDENCKCVADAVGEATCYNAAKKVYALRQEPAVTLSTTNGVTKAENVAGSSVSIQLNGDDRPYLYCPDHWTYDQPMCKTWDKGYTARDILRNMIDQYKRFYFYRFFRRGNPRFRERPYMWVNSVFRMFPFAHYALDLNYNKFQLADWQQIVLNQATDPFAAGVPQVRKEYLLAVQGKERWTENGEEQELTPGGPGDYMIAAMLGFNFLVYDVMYSVDVGKHVLSSWNDDPTKKYFLRNPYIYDDSDLEKSVGGAIIDIDMRYGHYHKNWWNRQDDLGITQAKFMRIGFTIEKEAAAFMLTNAGWWVDKYGYENMANGFSYVSDGFRNAIYQVMSDVFDEDHLWTFSRYCVSQNADQSFKLNVYEPRINELLLWNNTEIEGLAGAEASDTTKTLCEKLQADTKAATGTETVYIPVHASWVYFDKFTPALWALINLPNTMADNTVYRYFFADVIPVAQHDQWSKTDDVNSIECISGKEDTYYRAYNYPMDSRPSPMFNLVRHCKHIQDMCLIDKTKGEVPGNLGDTCDGYPRWYLQRTIDYMEATMLLLNSFGKWTTDIGAMVIL